jgi:hypothetical protein
LFIFRKAPVKVVFFLYLAVARFYSSSRILVTWEYSSLWDFAVYLCTILTQKRPMLMKYCCISVLYWSSVSIQSQVWSFKFMNIPKFAWRSLSIVNDHIICAWWLITFTHKKYLGRIYKFLIVNYGVRNVIVISQF